ncbi:class I SAM-dependent methyltransferase [Streptomyces sp. NPDC051001]|uniref:class I SAM-dependent methyltransferase n=1 Tax=Streptomyces sp. NPDC051001 TaxID=3155795 RepID=UPI003425929F
MRACPGGVLLGRSRSSGPGLDARIGSMLDLPMGNAELAGVVALSSLIHLQVEERTLAYEEFARVLRPGGADTKRAYLLARRLG